MVSSSAGESLNAAKPHDEETEDSSRTPPSEDQLKLMAKHCRLEQQIKTRGGRGRLSYDEIEKLVKADRSEQLKAWWSVGWSGQVSRYRRDLITSHKVAELRRCP